MSLRAFGWLHRLVGLYPKPKARTLSGEEQAFIAALDDVREKLEDFTRKIEARRATKDYVTPSEPWPRSVIKAPPWLVQRMAELKAATPPTLEEVQTQMRFSDALRRCSDQGMSYDEAKDYVEACADDIKAGMQTPWRRKIGENRYQGECGCIFNSDRQRVKSCGDHKSG